MGSLGGNEVNAKKVEEAASKELDKTGGIGLLEVPIQDGRAGDSEDVKQDATLKLVVNLIARGQARGTYN